MQPLWLVCNTVVATLIQGGGTSYLDWLWSRNTHYLFDYDVCLAAFFVYFVMTIWTAGSAIAGGVFVPVLWVFIAISSVSPWHTLKKLSKRYFHKSNCPSNLHVCYGLLRKFLSYKFLAPNTMRLYFGKVSCIRSCMNLHQNGPRIRSKLFYLTRK